MSDDRTLVPSLEDYFPKALAKLVISAAQIKPKVLIVEGFFVILNSKGKISSNMPQLVSNDSLRADIFFSASRVSIANTITSSILNVVATNLENICVIDIAYHTGHIVFLTSDATVIVALIGGGGQIKWFNTGNNIININTNYNIFISSNGLLTSFVCETNGVLQINLVANAGNEVVSNVVKHQYNYYLDNVILYYLLSNGTVMRKIGSMDAVLLPELKDVIDMVIGPDMGNYSLTFLTLTGEMYIYNEASAQVFRVSSKLPPITKLWYGIGVVYGQSKNGIIYDISSCKEVPINFGPLSYMTVTWNNGAVITTTGELHLGYKIGKELKWTAISNF